jgi:hypothetical protein
MPGGKAGPVPNRKALRVNALHGVTLWDKTAHYRIAATLELSQVLLGQQLRRS